MERQPQQFSSPEEEVAYLREQLAVREREMVGRSAEIDQTDVETVGKEVLKEYGSFTPKLVLHKEQQLSDHELSSSVNHLETSHDRLADVLQIASERGIHNALTVLEKMDDPHLTDDVHRELVAEIRQGIQIQNLKENSPMWQLLHMTLFEVVLPELSSKQEAERSVEQLSGLMQQWFAGLQTIVNDTRGLHYVFEIAVAEHSDDIVFYVAVPNDYISLFEKQTLSLFPHAELTQQLHDYNVFVDGGHTSVSIAKLKKHPIYPLRHGNEFLSDPLAVILNAFSKIDRDGGGAAVQLVVQAPGRRHQATYSEVVKRVQKGMKPSEAISRSTIGGEFMSSLSEMIFSGSKKEKDGMAEAQTIDQEALELFQRKLSAPIVDVNLRVVTAAREMARAEQMRSEIEATFHQFAPQHGNELVFQAQTGTSLRRAVKAFSFRERNDKTALPLNVNELATIVHFPANGIESSPQFKQSHAKTAAAPTELPQEGTLLGRNVHRGSERDVYVTNEDRLRHFYIIGQTGTGKTNLMKNMIIQDIQAGAGVCMIDPHGTDIDDVLAAVPPERADDVIYMDPSRQDRVMGLNMLEYDPEKPEQKTFVVNELFSIFQKLYSANPEAMGPMFEQYFRNATLLVMEDPESGNTMLDIARVMSDSAYRRHKLERAKNPVVVEFWRKIATQAGGEASLENIVPYIVSKFDVFTANDYMRPIIGQQQSAFNFRSIMDERKILLLNLSKGRLGEINANLIGMIVVGKLLMAALSRVDDPSKQFPPFYLHMDEFQNVSTDSISAILSEARKYKLGLTMAHQFMAQLDPAIKDSVFGNVGSIAAFRVGSEDAQALEQQFSPTFSASDLLHVPNRNAYVRMLSNGTPTRPFSLQTNAPPPPNVEWAQSLITQSYERHGRPRAEIEQEIIHRYQSA